MSVAPARPRWALSRAGRWAVALLFVADAWFWAHSSYLHAPLLGLCFSVLLQGGTHDPATTMAIVIEEGGILRVRGIYSEDGRRVQNSPRPGEVIRGHLLCIPQTRSWGLLAPVFVTFDH